MELSIARKDVELGIESASDTGPVGDLAAAQEVLERARLGARRLEDPQLELRATWVLWNFYMSCARVRLAQAEMVHFGRLAAREGTPFQRLVAQRMTGVTELLAGNLASARAVIDRVRSMSPGWDAGEPLKWYAYDPDVMARNTLVTLLWLDGKPDTATAVARDNAAHALAAGNDNTTPSVLADAACGMAIMVGNEDAAERYLARLDVFVGRGAPPGFGRWARFARAALAAGRGEVGPGLALLSEGPSLITSHPRFAILLTELAERLGAAGAVEPARRLAAKLLERFEASGEAWILSEARRICADLCEDDVAARALYQSALDTARSQGARAWALRAATSVARRWPDTAKEVLEPWLKGVTEGAGTRDVLMARAVLECAQKSASRFSDQTRAKTKT